MTEWREKVRGEEELRGRGGGRPKTKELREERIPEIKVNSKKKNGLQIAIRLDHGRRHFCRDTTWQVVMIPVTQFFSQKKNLLKKFEFFSK